jgi:lipoprotein-anchoring transpeptidase ErfK/SrfK
LERLVTSVLNVPSPMRYGQFVWNDEVARDGKVWVLVNLDTQTISVFRGQHEIGTAVALYGVDGKPTPLGSFRVLERRKDHQSSIYDAEMPYTLKLTNDGIAIHGSDVRAGVGTHGCIGIPLEFASKLFEAVEVGTEVFTVRSLGPVSPPITATATS